MASIVVYIELRGGAVTRPSRFVVAEARRVADNVGATVYAFFALGAAVGQTRIDELASEVSAAGADRILCSSADALAGPALDATQGVLLAQVAEHLRPLLFLFPAGGVGSELGPPLAVRIGAAYLANATIDLVAEKPAALEGQRVVLSRWRAAGDAQRRVDVAELERPVVASLSCGTVRARLGEPYAEVEMLPYPESSHAMPQLVSAVTDRAAEAEVCSALVWSPAPFDLGQMTGAGVPAGVALLVASRLDAAVLEGVSPREMFLLASVPANDPRPLALLAPGATVTRVAPSGTVPA